MMIIGHEFYYSVLPFSVTSYDGKETTGKGGVYHNTHIFRQNIVT